MRCNCCFWYHYISFILTRFCFVFCRQNRYEDDVAQGRFDGPIVEWHPQDGGPPLSELEKGLRYTPFGDAAQFERAYRNSVYLRGKRLDLNKVRCNSGFKMRRGAQVFYGEIKRFLALNACPLPGAPMTVFVEAQCWYASLPMDEVTYLPRAKLLEKAAYEGQGLSDFCLMSELESCTVSFYPIDASISAAFEFYS
jgi:hypothetical protein